MTQSDSSMRRLQHRLWLVRWKVNEFVYPHAQPLDCGKGQFFIRVFVLFNFKAKQVSKRVSGPLFESLVLGVNISNCQEEQEEQCWTGFDAERRNVNYRSIWGDVLEVLT